MAWRCVVERGEDRCGYLENLDMLGYFELLLGLASSIVAILAVSRLAHITPSHHRSNFLLL